MRSIALTFVLRGRPAPTHPTQTTQAAPAPLAEATLAAWGDWAAEGRRPSGDHARAAAGIGARRAGREAQAPSS